MKDRHLLEAIRRAQARRVPLPASGEEDERVQDPPWVTLGDIEACQSANTYPRWSRRAIRERCEQLAREGGEPRLRVLRAAGGLRVWVWLDAPAPSATGREPADPAEPATPVEDASVADHELPPTGAGA